MGFRDIPFKYHLLTGFVAGVVISTAGLFSPLTSASDSLGNGFRPVVVVLSGLAGMAFLSLPFLRRHSAVLVWMATGFVLGAGLRDFLDVAPQQASGFAGDRTWTVAVPSLLAFFVGFVGAVSGRLRRDPDVALGGLVGAVSGAWASWFVGSASFRSLIVLPLIGCIVGAALATRWSPSLVRILALGGLPGALLARGVVVEAYATDLSAGQLRTGIFLGLAAGVALLMSAYRRDPELSARV